MPYLSLIVFLCLGHIHPSSTVTEAVDELDPFNPHLADPAGQSYFLRHSFDVN